MAENKTTLNDQNVEQFLNTITDERKRQESFTIVAVFPSSATTISICPR